jgi:hypothetical protein
MANHMHFTAGHRGNHRLRMGGAILRRKHRLMESGDDQIERVNIGPEQSISPSIFLIFDSIPRRIPTPSTRRGQMRILTKCQ